MFCNIPLLCHIYEVDPEKRGNPTEVLRKDKKKGYFEALRGEDGRYHCIMPLWELGQITKKDGDTDDCWELCCKISIDSNGEYPIRFAESGPTGDIGYGKENIYSEKYLKVKKTIRVNI
jgi:hypothetical protein